MKKEITTRKQLQEDADFQQILECYKTFPRAFHRLVVLVKRQKGDIDHLWIDLTDNDLVDLFDLFPVASAERMKAFTMLVERDVVHFSTIHNYVAKGSSLQEQEEMYEIFEKKNSIRNGIDNPRTRKKGGVAKKQQLVEA